MTFLGHKHRKSLGLEHKGAIFNKVSLSPLKSQRTLTPEQACLLSVTLSKCLDVLPGSSRPNRFSSTVCMDQGKSGCPKHPEPQCPNKHTDLFILVIGIRSCRAERRKYLLSRMKGLGLEERKRRLTCSKLPPESVRGSDWA